MWLASTRMAKCSPRGPMTVRAPGVGALAPGPALGLVVLVGAADSAGGREADRVSVVAESVGVVGVGMVEVGRDTKIVYASRCKPAMYMMMQTMDAENKVAAAVLGSISCVMQGSGRGDRACSGGGGRHVGGGYVMAAGGADARGCEGQGRKHGSGRRRDKGQGRKRGSGRRAAQARGAGRRGC